MRKTLMIIAIIAVGACTFTSCSTYKSSSRSGCKATQGYVGYGGGR